MSIEIVPITRKNLDLAAKASAKYGIARSAQWLERCLFDPAVEDLVDDDVRGHMAVRDDGEVVAIQCYYYHPVYFMQEKKLMNTGCIMGADKNYGEELIRCLDANRERRILGVGSVANSVNARSSKICKIASKMIEAPVLTRQRRFAMGDITGYLLCAMQYVLHVPMGLINFSWLLMRPLSWAFTRVQLLCRLRLEYEIHMYDSFQTQKFQRYWKEFLAKNDGLITSRDPKRMSWLFDDSLKAGTAALIVAEKGNDPCGYVLVRKMRAEHGRSFSDYLICDICAIGHDEECLRALAFAAVSFVGKRGGLRLLMVGSLPNQTKWLFPALRHHLVYKHPTFMYKLYKGRGDMINESLKDGRGWFFGPLDGERCLGNEL